mmetsp:Transcript_22795/g.71422  ORF Transcript_22795/g.71422 Transcript_22795/m.71422 type:complete len:157 (+) Transcript_22795:616-1086(+)
MAIPGARRLGGCVDQRHSDIACPHIHPCLLRPLDIVHRRETSLVDGGGKWEITRKASKLLALNKATRPCLLCELSERFVERQPAVEIASFSRTPFSRSASPSALTLNKYSRSITALPACTSYDLFTPATPSLCGISPSSWNTIVSTTTPSPGSGAW